MATKTTKKSTAKTTTVAKKTAVKKTAPKKTTRATVAKSAPKMASSFNDVAMADVHNCNCGGNCHCGAQCHCSENCKFHCHGFGHFVKKFIIALILLALGFVAAKLCCCGHGMRAPHVKFASNGCMVEESVKCPKMRELLPAMDINQDGCITREEYREIKRQMHQQAEPQPQAQDVVDAQIDMAEYTE